MNRIRTESQNLNVETSTTIVVTQTIVAHTCRQPDQPEASQLGVLSQFAIGTEAARISGEIPTDGLQDGPVPTRQSGKPDVGKQAVTKELLEQLAALFALDRGSSTQSKHPILQARRSD